MNPLVPLLIAGMAFTFLICAGLLYIVYRVVIHFLEQDADHPLP